MSHGAAASTNGFAPASSAADPRAQVPLPGIPLAAKFLGGGLYYYFKVYKPKQLAAGGAAPTINKNAPPPPPPGAAGYMAPPPLPAGWQELQDPTTSRAYFYNSMTGESSWVRPGYV